MIMHSHHAVTSTQIRVHLHIVLDEMFSSHPGPNMLPELCVGG